MGPALETFLGALMLAAVIIIPLALLFKPTAERFYRNLCQADKHQMEEALAREAEKRMRDEEAEKERRELEAHREAAILELKRDCLTTDANYQDVQEIVVAGQKDDKE